MEKLEEFESRVLNERISVLLSFISDLIESGSIVPNEIRSEFDNRIKQWNVIKKKYA